MHSAAYLRGRAATSKRPGAWLGTISLVAGLACLLFVAVYSAAAGVRGSQPKGPTDLWSEYPLEPNARDAATSAPSAARGSARPAGADAPAAAQPVAQTAERSPSSLRIALLAGFGLAVLLATISALSVLLPARAGGDRRPEKAAAAALPARRPEDAKHAMSPRRTRQRKRRLRRGRPATAKVEAPPASEPGDAPPVPASEPPAPVKTPAPAPPASEQQPAEQHEDPAPSDGEPEKPAAVRRPAPARAGKRAGGPKRERPRKKAEQAKPAVASPERSDVGASDEAAAPSDEHSERKGLIRPERRPAPPRPARPAPAAAAPAKPPHKPMPAAHARDAGADATREPAGPAATRAAEARDPVAPPAQTPEAPRERKGLFRRRRPVHQAGTPETPAAPTPAPTRPAPVPAVPPQRPPAAQRQPARPGPAAARTEPPHAVRRPAAPVPPAATPPINRGRFELAPDAPAAPAPSPDPGQPNGDARPGATWFAGPHESCAISLWRGYMRAQFYARPTFPEPGDYALAVSPKFRLRGDTPKAKGAALAAYEALIEKLVRRGWEPSGLGGEWYEQWFRRQLPTGYVFPPVDAPPTARTPTGR